MNVKKLIGVFIAMAVFFLLIEYLWVGVLARSFYYKALATLSARKVYWLAAVPLYSIYITGILIFAVLPSQKANSLTKALSLGAFLGLFAYGTYNFTNLMILKKWPMSIILVDLTWGILLTCITSAVGFIVAQKLS
jgi:uncharacterized membrane protein